MHEHPDTGLDNSPSSPQPSARARHHWLYAAFALFTLAWGGNEFTPLLVFYKEQGTFQPVFIDSLMAFYAAGITVGLFLAGPLSDRFGRKALVLPGPVIAAVGSMLIALGEFSEIPMTIGRILSGLAVGVGMSACSSWIKELSAPRFDPKATPAAGAKRSTMALTSGFALGAASAGVLAQWGPIPGKLPYLVHVILAIIAFWGILTVPETLHPERTKKGAHPNPLANFKVALHPRFLTIVVPVAPWIFGTAGVSYAIMPTLIRDQVQQPVVFSALLALIALAAGYTIQQFSNAFEKPGTARSAIWAITFTIVGMLFTTFAVRSLHIWHTIVIAIVLGCAYGLCLISGLKEVQRLAKPHELGSLTAVYYAFSYIGFFFPMILTKLSEWFTYVEMMGFGVVMAMLALIIVSSFSRKNLPAPPAPPAQ